MQFYIVTKTCESIADIRAQFRRFLPLVSKYPDDFCAVGRMGSGDIELRRVRAYFIHRMRRSEGYNASGNISNGNRLLGGNTDRGTVVLYEYSGAEFKRLDLKSARTPTPACVPIPHVWIPWIRTPPSSRIQASTQNRIPGFRIRRYTSMCEPPRNLPKGTVSTP